MKTHTLTPCTRSILIARIIIACTHPSDLNDSAKHLSDLSDSQLIRTANLLGVSVECAN